MLYFFLNFIHKVRQRDYIKGKFILHLKSIKLLQIYRRNKKKVRKVNSNSNKGSISNINEKFGSLYKKKFEFLVRII